MNEGLWGLREIRVLQARRGSKGIPAVPARRVTKAIRALWDRRGFQALPERGDPEEIQGR